MSQFDPPYIGANELRKLMMLVCHFLSIKYQCIL